MLRSLFRADVDELEPGRGRVDRWAPIALPLAMLVAKIAADTLAERNKRLSDTLTAVQAQRDELRRQLDDLIDGELRADLADVAPVAGAGQDKPAGAGDQDDDTEPGPQPADWRPPLVDEDNHRAAWPAPAGM